MADPLSLTRPRSSSRYDPNTLDAKGRAVGDVLTVVDDGTGGKRSAWRPDPGGGIAAGTPGNLSLTLLAGPPTVCRNVDAALREYKGLKRARKYWNTASIEKARLQPNVWAPASAGSELHLVYSLDGGSTFAESGVFVRCDRVNFPEPGAYLALDPLARGANVLFSLATKNGDGTLTLKVSDVFVDTVSSDAPPDSPSGDPPETGDLPEGGGWGDIVWDVNALGAVFAARAYADGADVALWPDETTLHDMGTAAVLLLPKYRATGFTGGKPCVEWAGSNVALTNATNPTAAVGEYTYYFVLDALDGGGDTARIFGAGLFDTFAVAFDCTSTHITGVNNGAYGAINVADDWGMSSAHIYRFVKALASWHLYVDGVLKASASASVGTNNDGTSFLMDYLTGIGLAGKLARGVAFNLPHTTASGGGTAATGLTGPELNLQLIWGTP